MEKSSEEIVLEIEDTPLTCKKRCINCKYHVTRQFYRERKTDNKIRDVKSKEFKNCFNIDCNKCQNLTGFKLMGYKEFVFMYGGEFLIGRGNWNTNFWVYDTIREKWERKGVMPFVRRHFETCMVGNNLYIMGGTGMYRLLQENMVWYNFKDDKWSGQIKLPCTSRQLKCCSFLNSFFILNINNKCGYFFNDNSSNWNKLVIKGDVTNCNSEFSIFANRSKLYVKGKNLTEFIVQDNELVLVSVKHITDMCYEKMETALCNDTIYTLYMRRFEDNDMYSLETYNLETGITDFIFQDVFNESIVSTDSQGCISSMSIFPLQYYILVEKNAMINDCFE
ncbi:hypothetical protein NQ318_009978 [Aromia moschata]|uniref:Kelch motif family protein n=1 Tax=Aromia moschata TaxID=1265417 RepID=A0AAV8YAI4_9CUCU|nr:hypothetical protein NQ318_009978 [Aromia moschata]